jgi:hypothetical protein
MFIEPETTGPALRQEGHVYRTRDRNPALRVHIGALAFNQTWPSWRRAGPVVSGSIDIALLT